MAKDKSIDTVRKYLQVENISWPNFFDNYENPSINLKYHIESYFHLLFWLTRLARSYIGQQGKIQSIVIKEILTSKL